MTSWIYVGIGGALGAMLRFATQSAFERVWPTVPAGTAVVNAVGSLVIGALLPLLPWLPEATRPFVVVGVLGGLTTFSSFSGELVTLLDQGRPLAAGLHWLGGAVLCIGLCALGYVVASKFAGSHLKS